MRDSHSRWIHRTRALIYGLIPNRIVNDTGRVNYSSFRYRHGYRLLVALLVCLYGLAGGAAAQDYELPTIGQPADTVLSPAEEQRLGAQVVAQLLQRGYILEDIELRHYLGQVGARLIRTTTQSPSDFRFFVIEDSGVNAFALPGGFIGINAGLITETETESELAGVMAHEIAHVTQRHIARQIQATQGMGWAALAAVLVAAIAGGDGDAISAAITGGMSALHQQRVSFTRAHELEADRIGIRTLAAANFNPDGMASFFEKMQRRSRLYGNQLPQILLSHPVNNTRVAEAETRAQDYPSPTVVESDDYALMKERTRVLMSSQMSDMLRYYESRGAPGEAAAAENYGYALTLARVGRASEAVDILRGLANTYPEQSHYVVALARAQSISGHIGSALDTLEAALQAFPRAPAVKLDYAETLIDSGQPEAARNFLISRHGLTRGTPLAQKLLAQAAGMQGHLGEAYYRQAQYYQLRGAYAAAIRQLRTALHTTELNNFDQTRLEALLGQIVAQCNAAWSERECRERVLDNGPS